MSSGRIGKGLDPRRSPASPESRRADLSSEHLSPPSPYNTCTVFVTGNAGKLREVREILTNGPQPIEIESHSIDCEFPLGYNPFGHREMKH